ncbi:MAG: DUF6776 family protein [Pseudomonadota bacterium]|nr:DUF6776 family protein [Pseudomonadota bacterium]
MGHRRHVVSPKIVVPGGGGVYVFVTLLVLIAIGAAFYGGMMLDDREQAAQERRVAAFAQERTALAEQIDELRQQNIILGRTQQIDREANRNAREQLKGAQNERLALEKEVSFLRRLISEGGGGILQVKGLELAETDEEGKFAYSFTVSQLIQDFGLSEGDVEIKIVGEQDGKEATVPLAKLSGSEPKGHKMRFKHFQNFEGEIKVPSDLEPASLIVEVKPKTKKLIPITETFAWETGD